MESVESKFGWAGKLRRAQPNGGDLAVRVLIDPLRGLGGHQAPNGHWAFVSDLAWNLRKFEKLAVPLKSGEINRPTQKVNEKKPFQGDIGRSENLSTRRR
jgi:hypothetical protein